MTLRNVIIKWDDAADLVSLFRDLFEDIELSLNATLTDDERYELDLALRDLRETERGLRGTVVKVRVLLTDAQRREISTPLHLEVEVTRG